MRYQRAGLQVSVLLHAMLFMLVFCVSRLLPAPSGPIAIDLGIVTGSVEVPGNDAHEKILHQQVKRPVVKPAVQQPKIYSEPAMAEKPEVKQEQATVPEATDASVKTGDLGTTNKASDGAGPAVGELGSDNKASDIVGPAFDVDYLHNPKPQYPLIARRMKLEGTVIVHVLVNASGKPEVVRLEKSSGVAVLDQAALDAVQSWSFLPARQGSKAVPAWVDIPLRFRLI
jgi:periplasmic protein TonB